MLSVPEVEIDDLGTVFLSPTWSANPLGLNSSSSFAHHVFVFRHSLTLLSRRQNSTVDELTRLGNLACGAGFRCLCFCESELGIWESTLMMCSFRSCRDRGDIIWWKWGSTTFHEALVGGLGTRRRITVSHKGDALMTEGSQGSSSKF
jgi:hypothetical protein